MALLTTYQCDSCGVHIPSNQVRFEFKVDRLIEHLNCNEFGDIPAGELCLSCGLRVRDAIKGNT